MWVWVGLAWARYFALSLPTAAAAAAAAEAPVARAGFFPRLRGVLGVAAWPAEAVARPAGAAVATPGAPSSFSSAAVAADGEAPVARAGSVPGFRGVLGVAAWPAEAAARPARDAAATPRAPSSLSFAAVAAAGEAPVARAGSVPCFRGVLRVAAWSAKAVARPAGAAVATPRAPFSLPSAAAAALGDASGSCAGATPRVGGVPGAAVGAAAWLAEGTHGLEPATSKLGPSVTANGAGDVKDGQPMTNHHDCHFLGKQLLFACRNGYYIAAVAVHTKDHTVKGLLAYVNFGHGEDVHGHALHGLVRHQSPLGFTLDVPVVGIAGLTDQATLSDLLDSAAETDLVDFEPVLHIQGLLLDPWVHHVVVPSLT